jgi:hypothetical protein
MRQAGMAIVRKKGNLLIAVLFSSLSIEQTANIRQVYDMPVSVQNYDAPHADRLHGSAMDPML